MKPQKTKQKNMERQFLGWHKPQLHLAAEYLMENHTINGRLDLKSVTVVLPTKRAVIRLEEILATEAKKMDVRAWYPPEMLTPESFPEKFYVMKNPVAAQMMQWLVWMDALRQLDERDPAARKTLLPDMPETFIATITLGKMLADYHYELAAQGIDFKKVAEKCKEWGLEDEVKRWHALAHLQKIYANDAPQHEGILDKLGYWDLQAARLYAIEKQDEKERKEIVRQLEERTFYLAGLVDLNKLQKDILKKFSPHIKMTSLIFAPKEDKKIPNIQSCFDEFGGLCVDSWQEIPLEIADDNISIAWQPENEADETLKRIDSLEGKNAAGEIVISVPDKEVVPFLQERLAEMNLHPRHIEGTTVKQTNVYHFLESLLKFIKTCRFRDYAELLRHPDVEQYIKQNIKQDNIKDYITQLDRYYNKFFPETVSDEWKSKEKNDRYDFDALPHVWKSFEKLLGFSPAQIVLKTDANDCIILLVALLDRLYPQQHAVHGKEKTADIIGIVNRGVEKISKIPSDLLHNIFTAKTKENNTAKQESVFAKILELLLIQIESKKIVPPSDKNTIELIGWLDAAMDDAPVAVITGMNDGIIPSHSQSDIFLPDSLRYDLGVTNNRSRAARDLYALMVIQETRKGNNAGNNNGRVFFIAARRTTDGDPRLPSRFFFMSEDTHKVAVRVKRFFTEEKNETSILFNSAFQSGAFQPGCKEKHNFNYPPLPPLLKPIEKLSVTGLKSYLLCPYRYYLEQLCSLNSIDDSAEELPPSDFGNLIHDVLFCFGKDEIKNSKSAKDIRRFLDAHLEERKKELFGASPRATIAIQIARARARLHTFADWQVQWREKGYEIADVEWEAKPPVTIEGIKLSGRIDRIDKNCKTGEIVVIDYKTGSIPKFESEVYNSKKDEWKDFQLVLYHHILRESEYTNGNIRLAYLPIPADVSSIDIEEAHWHEDVINNGIDRAKVIVKEILMMDKNRAAIKPNPAFKAPFWGDKFAAICLADLE